MVRDAREAPVAPELDAAARDGLSRLADALGLSFRGLEDGYLAFDVNSGNAVDRAHAKALAACVVAELRSSGEGRIRALPAEARGVRIVPAAARERAIWERIPA